MYNEEIKNQLVLIVLLYQCIDFGFPFVEGIKLTGGDGHDEKKLRYLVGDAAVGVGAGGFSLQLQR
jgi:hypothetical protein